MQVLEWSPSLSVNVGSIDHEHEAMIGIINELHTALQAHSPREMLGGILGRLLSYAVGHFGHEERIMQRLNYSEYESHKAEHDEFAAKVRALKEEFARGEDLVTDELIQYLRVWLKEHIQGTDRKYSEAFNLHGYR